MASPSKGSRPKDRLCRYVIIHGFCKFEGQGCEFNHDVPKKALNTVSSSPDLRRANVRPDQQAFQNTKLGKTGFKHDQGTSGYIGDGSHHAPNYRGKGHRAHEFPNMNPYHAPTYEKSEHFSFYNPYDQPQGLPIARLPLDYSLYKSAVSLLVDPKKQKPAPNTFFIADSLREELQKKGEAVMDAFLPHHSEFPIPHELHSYHNLTHMESAHQRSSRIFGFPTWVFKAINTVDGKPYALRRIEGFRLMNEGFLSACEGWRRIRHSCIVSFREGFSTTAFGDNSLIFVHDYFPLAETLHAKHFSSVLAAVPESTVWTYITQIASALKTIHSSGLAARTIEPSKIMLTSSNRIRLNCCGIFDVINYDGGKSLQMHQHDDLIHFGQLLVALACGSLSAVANIAKSMEHISATCSADLKNLILFLLSKPSNLKTIDDVLMMIGPRVLDEVNMAHSHNDYLEEELFKELRNASIFKMLCYLGFINDRPQFDMDPSWSETGDRYLLKLFRDYVFHQVDETGNPYIDFGHIISCINKLDAGVNEKIMLMSRDDQSCLIVTYSDLKKCVEATYCALRR